MTKVKSINQISVKINYEYFIQGQNLLTHNVCHIAASNIQALKTEEIQVSQMKSIGRITSGVIGIGGFLGTIHLFSSR